MKLNKLLLLGVAMLSFVYIGCDKSEETAAIEPFTLGETVQRSFTGKIVDTNNNPLSNVTITMSGQTTTTSADGTFSLNNISCLERFAYLTAEKSGFITGSRVVFPTEGVAKCEVMLLPEVVVATIPSGQTSVVTLTDNTRVAFDGAFMTQNGTAYNGNVKVVMNHLDPADKDVFKKMPGNLIGTRNDGSISGMETYGMIVVEMKGTNNEKLQIMTGHTANVTMPIPANQMDTAPTTIPLWHFNQANGMWEENGYSRKIGSNYVSTVSHFSWWNNDDAYQASVLTVIATNYDATPVNGVRVTITRRGGSTGDVLIDLGTTGANGRLSANTPLNEELIFRAYSSENVLLKESILPPTTLRARTEYVNVYAPNRLSR
jgi:hypothetical protein